MKGHKPTASKVQPKATAGTQRKAAAPTKKDDHKQAATKKADVSHVASESKAAKKEPEHTAPKAEKKPEAKPAEKPKQAENIPRHSVIDTKKLADEKKELAKQLADLKKENVELKNKLSESEKMNNELMDEISASQTSSETFIKDKNEMEAQTRKAQLDLKNLQLNNEELTKKLADLTEDMEILKEENEVKDLENQLTHKKFEEFKQNTDIEIRKLKAQSASQTLARKSAVEVAAANNGEAGGENPAQNSAEKPKEAEGAAQAPAEDPVKISEYEELIMSLSSQLQSATDQRDYAITYYKEQMANLNKEMEEFKTKSSVVPEKDELIKQLTEKLKEDEGIMESFKSQINALSPANDMYEQIIIEKDELEKQMEDLKLENEKMKEDLANDEEMVNDLESALKITEQMMKKSQDDVLEAKNKEEELNKQILDYEENQKNLINKLDELKKANKIIKEEASKFKDSNVNFDDILSKNMTTANKILTLQRQSVLISINEIDIEKYSIRNKLIKNMIPKKMFESAYIDSIDKFLNIQCNKKKVFEIIMNKLDNEILTEDLATNPYQSSEEKLEKIEGENLKKLANFYKDVLNELIKFFNSLLKIEIFLSLLNNEDFIKVTRSDKFIAIYNNINAGISIFDALIKLIKIDSFSIQFQHDCDTLKIINDKITEQIASLENFKENNLNEYLMEIFYYFVNVACGFKVDRVEILINNLDKSASGCDKLKAVYTSFLESNKNFKNILGKLKEKFFQEFSYKLTNNVFDVTNSYYKKLKDINPTLPTELAQAPDENFDQKYTTLLDNFNKVCVVISSQIEKYDKIKDEKIVEEPPKEENAEGGDKDNEQDKDKEQEKEKEAPKIQEEKTITINPDRELLPLPNWYNLTGNLFSELSNVSLLHDEVEKARKKLKDEKVNNANLQSKYNELERSKNENDNKLGELVIKVGKISQLESQNEDYVKRIDKYKIAVENLQKTAEEQMAKVKEYKSKYEKIANKREANLLAKKSTRAGLGQAASVLGQSLGQSTVMGGDGFTGNYAPLLNTVCMLQKERKYYRTKLMKEKLNKLIEDHDSFMNQFIKKEETINKHEPEIERKKDAYRNLAENVKNLNKNYDNVRQKLCMPKILDISSDKYNYNGTKTKEDNELNNMRIKYIQDADKILFNLFGDNTVERTFKEVIDNDISRTLNRFSQQPSSVVGKLRFNANKKEESKEQNLEVPVIISEEGLKMLNKTFMH